MAGKNQERLLIIMRHGERMDFAFGEWIPKCFDQSGVYRQRDLNMPSSVPNRTGSPSTFFMDGPLTRVGNLQALATGESLQRAGITISHAFCSPSLRCVETCTNVIKGMGMDLPLYVEPGLFEWLHWYRRGLPHWMTNEELAASGFRLKMNYKPLLTLSDLERIGDEPTEGYYGRSYYVTKNIVDATAVAGGNVLLVGHAATLDTCSRQLTGKPARPLAEMQHLLGDFPYCSAAFVRQSGTPAWQLIEPPIPHFSNPSNNSFNWKVLLHS